MTVLHPGGRGLHRIMVALKLQQCQCNLKKILLRRLVFPVRFGPSEPPPPGGLDFEGGGVQRVGKVYGTVPQMCILQLCDCTHKRPQGFRTQNLLQFENDCSLSMALSCNSAPVRLCITTAPRFVHAPFQHPGLSMHQ